MNVKAKAKSEPIVLGILLFCFAVCLSTCWQVEGVTDLWSVVIMTRRLLNLGKQ